MTQEALKLALEFVKSINLGSRSASVEQQRQVITAIKEALAQTQEPVAWTLADKVRQDLDQQSCPDAFMRIAVESIVKHHPPQRTEQLKACVYCGQLVAKEKNNDL